MSGVHPVTLEGDGPWRVETLNSRYLVRRALDGWRVTRRWGRNDPTPNTGEDGVWQPATLVEILENGTMLVTWDAQRATLTSTVERVIAF